MALHWQDCAAVLPIFPPAWPFANQLIASNARCNHGNQIIYFLTYSIIVSVGSDDSKQVVKIKTGLRLLAISHTDSKYVGI